MNIWEQMSNEDLAGELLRDATKFESIRMPKHAEFIRAVAARLVAK